MLTLLRDWRAVALLLAATLTILSNTIMSPALPGLDAAFAGQPHVHLIVRMLVTAPSLAVAFLAPFAGALADRFKRRSQLLAGVLLFAMAGSAGAWLQSLTAILFSRFLLGAAVALVMTAQTALVGDYFRGDARSRFMSLQLSATNFSGLVFILLAGWLAEYSAFLPFAIYAVALLYLPVIWFAVEDTGRGRSEEDFASDSGESDWPTTLGAVIVMAALSLMGFYLVPTQLPFFLVSIGHPEPTVLAMILAALTLAGGLVALAYATVRRRLGRRFTPVIGYVLFAMGFGCWFAAHGLTLVVIAVLLIGAAAGLLFPIFLSIAIDVAPARRRGIASGAVTTSIFTGQFLSPVVGQPLIHCVGFSTTFAIAGSLFVVLATIALVAFRERPRSPLGVQG